VRTVTVGVDSAGASREFAAEVRARTESRLGFRVGGKMLSRSAEVGQRVQAGQTLAQLDATDLRLGQEAAQAAVRAAQSAHDLAAAELKRYRELRDQGFISGLELERRETTLQAQQAQLEQARAQAGVQGNQARYAVLQAPAAGVVTAVEAEPGAVLAAGALVLRLAHDGPRDAVFAVPEDGIAGMRPLHGKAGALQVQPVEVGGADGNAVVVTAGLAPGQTVVTAGVHTLTPGQKVRLFEVPPLAAPAASPSARPASAGSR